MALYAKADWTVRQNSDSGVGPTSGRRMLRLYRASSMKPTMDKLSDGMG